jgi:hypothetical protein
MKIAEAVAALEAGQTINNANSGETIVAKNSDTGMKVTCTNSAGIQQIMHLSRMRQLYRGHDFGKGPAPKPVATETPAK